MEVSGIPKFFWISLSLCMLIATCGIVFIAYRSSSVSIEIANAKINLNAALNTTKYARNDLEEELAQVKKIATDIKSKINLLRTLSRPNQPNDVTIENDALQGTDDIKNAQKQTEDLLKNFDISITDKSSQVSNNLEELDKVLQNIQQSLDSIAISR